MAYINPETGEATEQYPYNPNGTAGGMAALSDSTGRLFGMMPHPEAFVHRTHHPQWTRREIPLEGDGLILFKNAINYIRDNF
jgi:phosphoribosylformylglycinamidine synthase